MEKDQSKGAVEELIALEAVRNVIHIQWHSLFQAIFILAQFFFGSESFGILIRSNCPLPRSSFFGRFNCVVLELATE